MKSICFFSSYFNQNYIPYYIKYYLEDLKKYFSEVVFLNNKKQLIDADIKYLQEKNITLKYVSNEGFDFGMWYKAFLEYDVNNYDRVALVNDSCVLFKPLDDVMNWSKKDASDFQGITQSQSISKHIQSYFLIFNGKIISDVKNYFLEHKICNTIKEVISIYEIGLSHYLLEKNYKMATFINDAKDCGEFSPSFFLIEEHIKKEIPVIKKKIIFSSYRKDELFTLARMNFNIRPDFYIQLIQKNNANAEIIDFSSVKKDFRPQINSFQKIIYEIEKNGIQIFKKIKNIF